MKTEILNNLSAVVSVLGPVFFHRPSALTRVAHDFSVITGKHICTYTDKEHFSDGQLWVYPKYKSIFKGSTVTTLVYINNWQVCNEMTALTTYSLCLYYKLYF
jgi:hypothetical protein